MICCQKYRFLFLKTSKTAGTSLEIYLSQFCGPEDIVTPIKPEDEAIRTALGYQGPTNFMASGTRLFNHIPATSLRACLGPTILKTFLKFTVVRNPFDRAISLFWWRRRRDGLGLAKLPLDELRTRVGLFIDRMPPEALTNWHIYGAPDGRTLLVDRVIRYENLKADLAATLRACGLEVPVPITLPVAKASLRRRRDLHYSQLLPNAAIRKITEAAEPELKAFGYRA